MQYERVWIVGISLSIVAALTQPALGWGSQGHLLLSTAGARSFPEELPAFVRTPEAIAEIGTLGPELDTSKGSGAPHDFDLDPGHYVDLDDDGNATGVLSLDALPAYE